jgi:hypothetical protein
MCEEEGRRFNINALQCQKYRFIEQLLATLCDVEINQSISVQIVCGCRQKQALHPQPSREEYCIFDGE